MSCPVELLLYELPCALWDYYYMICLVELLLLYELPCGNSVWLKLNVWLQLNVWLE